MNLRMKLFVNLSLSVFIATPLIAQDVPSGCFVRDYSEDHLAQNPEQIVDRISILFGPIDGLVLADVKVQMANQGHAAVNGYGGAYFSEVAGTFSEALTFAVDCDGGFFDVVHFDGDSIEIETSGFRLSPDGCGDQGNVSNLLETGSSSTTYTLNRTELGACFW